jgi:hypothetical protein
MLLEANGCVMLALLTSARQSDPLPISRKLFTDYADYFPCNLWMALGGVSLLPTATKGLIELDQ